MSDLQERLALAQLENEKLREALTITSKALQAEKDIWANNFMPSDIWDEALNISEQALSTPPTRADLDAYVATQFGEPFGIWHEGATEDESDFYLWKDSGDVACDKCIKLYAKKG